MKDMQVKLVVFGRGGDSVYYASEGNSHCTGSGYGSPESPHAADFARKTDVTVTDGTPVIDMRAAVETKEGYLWVIKGPMVDVDLADGTVDKCLEPSALMAFAMTSDGGNAYGGLLAEQKIHKAVAPAEPGPLDSVSVRAYVDGWRKHGAKIGHYVARKIVWES